MDPSWDFALTLWTLGRPTDPHEKKIENPFREVFKLILKRTEMQ
jgi:hypothetical protein